MRSLLVRIRSLRVRIRSLVAMSFHTSIDGSYYKRGRGKDHLAQVSAKYGDHWFFVAEASGLDKVCAKDMYSARKEYWIADETLPRDARDLQAYNWARPLTPLADYSSGGALFVGGIEAMIMVSEGTIDFIDTVLDCRGDPSRRRPGARAQGVDAGSNWPPYVQYENIPTNRISLIDLDTYLKCMDEGHQLLDCIFGDLAKGRRILVACMNGAHRSALICAILLSGSSVHDPLSYVRDLRAIAVPRAPWENHCTSERAVEEYRHMALCLVDYYKLLLMTKIVLNRKSAVATVKAIVHERSEMAAVAESRLADAREAEQAAAGMGRHAQERSMLASGLVLSRFSNLDKGRHKLPENPGGSEYGYTAAHHAFGNVASGVARSGGAAGSADPEGSVFRAPKPRSSREPRSQSRTHARSRPTQRQSWPGGGYRSRSQSGFQEHARGGTWVVKEKWPESNLPTRMLFRDELLPSELQDLLDVTVSDHAVDRGDADLPTLFTAINSKEFDMARRELTKMPHGDPAFPLRTARTIKSCNCITARS